jgi:hypothetical protein
MLKEIAVIVGALFIILLITILMSNTNTPPTPHLPHHCKCEGNTEAQRAIFEDMNATASHPKYQPIYTLYRSTPKDTVTNVERKYCAQTVKWFSKQKLTLLDIENVSWMAENESTPIICQLDARVKLTETDEVVRVIMMWQQRQLWVIHLANAKGCHASIQCAKNCEVEYGVISNQTIQMDQYKVMKSIMGREQKFEWDNTGALITDPETTDTPMINSAWTTRPPEIFQNPTLPHQSGEDKLNQQMFFKTFGIPRK